MWLSNLWGSHLPKQNGSHLLYRWLSSRTEGCWKRPQKYRHPFSWPPAEPIADWHPRSNPMCHQAPRNCSHPGRICKLRRENMQILVSGLLAIMHCLMQLTEMHRNGQLVKKVLYLGDSGITLASQHHIWSCLYLCCPCHSHQCCICISPVPSLLCDQRSSQQSCLYAHRGIRQQYFQTNKEMCRSLQKTAVSEMAARGEVSWLSLLVWVGRLWKDSGSWLRRRVRHSSSLGFVRAWIDRPCKSHKCWTQPSTWSFNMKLLTRLETKLEYEMQKRTASQSIFWSLYKLKIWLCKSARRESRIRKSNSISCLSW